MPVGYIGLGKMGGNMALRLLETGHELVVTEISKEVAAPVLDAGATWADSPAAVAEAADIVLSSLPGPAQVKEVALGSRGIVQTAGESTLYIDMSTSTPTQIQAVGSELAKKGAHTLDAPVSGSFTMCREGTIAIWVGGEAADVERAQIVFTDLARVVTHIGALGTASVAKLVNNAAGLSTFKLLGECLSVGAKAGLDPRALLKVLSEGAYGQGLFHSMMIPNIALKHAFDDPMFSLALGTKDLRLATELGKELGVPLPMLESVVADGDELIARGHGNQDVALIFALQEERADVRMADADAKEISL